MQTSQSYWRQHISRIGFHTAVWGAGVNMGYGYAAVELIKAWQRQGIPVWAMDEDAPIQFSFCQPQFYHDPVPGKLNIGYTPWESTYIPKAWVARMNEMDEIWTTCEANRDWFQKGGVQVPVRVLHHGLNRSHYPVKKRKSEDTFRFLHIGEPSPRKGGSLVYEVFRETFDGREDITLTIKGKPTIDLRRQIYSSPNVVLVEDHYTQEQMTELYLSHHAMIYPTNGEGFGFIPFQAAATGMPTAVTNWSGPQDFMEYCHPISTGKLIAPGYEPHVGLWADPEPESVAMWMKYFVESPDYFFGKAYRKARQMDAWSWDNIAAISLNYLLESLKVLPQE